MKTLKIYLKKRETAISFLLGKPRQKHTSATLHKLRVEIKKLDAVFDLINFCSKNFSRDKYFKPSKQIFSQAGKVREIQLEETMLKKYVVVNSLKGYRNNLKKQLLKEQDEFFIVANKKKCEKIKNTYHQIAPYVHNVNSKNGSRYIKKRKEAIEKIISLKHLQVQNAEQLHQLRKQLKKINYNRKSLSIENENKHVTNKNELSVLLGKWHDCQVIIHHMQSVIEKGEINLKETGQLEKVKQKISADCELQLKKIQRAIPKSEFFKPGKLPSTINIKKRITLNKIKFLH